MAIKENSFYEEECKVCWIEPGWRNGDRVATLALFRLLCEASARSVKTDWILSVIDVKW